MFRNRKTKIVATIGPASRKPEVMRAMIENGMDIARLNFSHGNFEEHTESFEMVKEQSKIVGRPVGIFQDLSGPKVRIGEIENGSVDLKDGDLISLRPFSGDKGNAKHIFVEAFNPIEVIKPGEKVLLSDGRLQLRAKEVTANEVICYIECGGNLRQKAGIAVPESKLSLPCITEKDLHDINWGLEKQVDYIAFSFVGNAQDVLDLKKIIADRGGNIPVISKLERASALEDIQAIADISDCIMVARGDLGVEVPLETVPWAQKLIIDTSNFTGTPVITATQMLVSMVNELRPTRAEVSDVCTAVRDGTDAVMLSEETTIGKHPHIAVKVMSDILVEAEKQLALNSQPEKNKGTDQIKIPDAVSYAACFAAEKIGANAIMACTLTGNSARMISKYRPQQPIYGVTPNPKAIGRMAMYWGVEPVLIEEGEVQTLEEEVAQTLAAGRDVIGLKPGSRVVVTAGLKSKKSGGTNVMQIREIPRAG